MSIFAQHVDPVNGVTNNSGCRGSFADPEPRFIPDLGSSAPEDGLMSDVQFFQQAMRQLGDARQQLSHRLRILLGTDDFTLYPTMKVTPHGVKCSVLISAGLGSGYGDGGNWNEAMDKAVEVLRLAGATRETAGLDRLLSEVA